jgi:hypothetical protein
VKFNSVGPSLPVVLELEVIEYYQASIGIDRDYHCRFVAGPIEAMNQQ